MNLKEQVLNMLKATKGFVSGQELCEKLGVSRTAVWKVIHGLLEEGYGIQRVRNKGYLLEYTPDIMTKAELSGKIKSRWAGRILDCHTTIDSTNNRGKMLGEKEGSHGTLVVSDEQTAGKGRRGRIWISDPGNSIYMSIILKPKMPTECAPMLTLVSALALCAGIEEVTGLQPSIKWPNDIVVKGKKICGILTEMSGDMDYIRYVIVGMGINVNTEVFPEDLLNHATSLYQQMHQFFNRGDLIAGIMKHLEYYYDRFMEHLDLRNLVEIYNYKMINRNQEVRVLAGKNEYTGIALGITQKGELLVQCDSGEIKTVFFGEVSVRGVYGYI